MSNWMLADLAVSLYREKHGRFHGFRDTYIEDDVELDFAGLVITLDRIEVDVDADFDSEGIVPGGHATVHTGQLSVRLPNLAWIADKAGFVSKTRHSPAERALAVAVGEWIDKRWDKHIVAWAEERTS